MHYVPHAKIRDKEKHAGHGKTTSKREKKEEKTTCNIAKCVVQEVWSEKHCHCVKQETINV